MNKRLIKILGASTLALIMGAGVLCGTIIPMNSACATTSAGATASSNSANLAGAAQLGDSAKEEWAENILSGDLNLDPENDPVVYTTDYGLDIKFHDAFTEVDDVGLSSYKGSTGFLYFTMGAYSGTPVNWIIIGRASDVTFSDYYIYDGTYSLFGKTFEKEYVAYTVSDYPNWPTVNAEYYKNNIQETTTPAGAAISADATEELIRDYRIFWVTNLPVVNDDELDSGEILCLSEKNICLSVFITPGNNYSGSTLQTTINTLYDSGLGLTDAQQSAIQPQALSTAYSGGTSSISGQYLFPLAGDSSSESYYVGTYLNSTTKRDIDAYWWLRSGHTGYSGSAYYVNADGSVGTHGVNNSFGVRPAFVLKL